MKRIPKCFSLLAGLGMLAAQAVGPKSFSTPEEAKDALIQAAAQSFDAVKGLMGPGSDEVLRTGDSVQDQAVLQRFNERVKQKAALLPDEMDRDRETLLVGDEETPFPIPLLRKNGRWYFDIQEGKAEIRRRVIGGNELDAIEICRGYVEAQETYAEADRDGNGVLEYAQKIASTPGKKDGLYWPGGDSPISEGVAKAIAQGYGSSGGPGKGYHGYHVKILLAQGPDAPEGAEDYVAHGLMIGGFALVAWPVEYGISGIMTFIVNQDGVVYQKDLGPQTGAAARAMAKFNPDKTWTVVPEE